MSPPKLVLVVDDYFETLSFLKSLLELTFGSVRVVGVPSAEEGMLELHQTAYDLLITDLRLPGIDGFDLVHRARRLRPKIKIVLMTAYSTAEVLEAADELEVLFLRKPLDSDHLLAIVGESLDLAPTGPPNPVQNESANLADRLERLRRQTGADQALLFQLGNSMAIMPSEGHSLRLLDLQPALADVVRYGLAVATELGASPPALFQLLGSGSQQLLVANVGSNHGLALCFAKSESRRRPMSLYEAVVESAGQLAGLLQHHSDAPPRSHEPATNEVSPELEAAGSRIADGVVSEDLGPVANGTAADETPTGTQPASFPADEAPASDLSWLLDESVEGVDLDAYWEEAATSEGLEVPGSGLSWEEAVSRGLVSTEAPDLG